MYCGGLPAAAWPHVGANHDRIYIYIYIERERDLCVVCCVYIYIYIYAPICIHCMTIRTFDHNDDNNTTHNKSYYPVYVYIYIYIYIERERERELLTNVTRYINIVNCLTISQIVNQ